MQMSSSSQAALVWFFGGVLLAFFLYLIVGVGRLDNDPPEAVTTCIERLKPTMGRTTVINVRDLYGLNGFCYDTIGSQLKIDQEKIRRDGFVFQRNENIVILYMVVLITLAGVVLAGVQLLASYKLAVLGRADIASGGTEINYSGHSISFKSSVVGLAILAMSFAFFIVYVIYVYNMREISSAAASRTGPQTVIPAELPTNLLPVLPPPDQPHVAISKPATPTTRSNEASSSPQPAGQLPK